MADPAEAFDAGAEPPVPPPVMDSPGKGVSLGPDAVSALGLNGMGGGVPGIGGSPAPQEKPGQEAFPMPDFGKLEARLASDQAAALKAIQAGGDAQRAQIDFQTRQETGQRDVENQAADRAIALKEAYDRELAKEPLPKYIPEKDNINQVGTMMAAMGIIGAILGKGGGQQSAMGAMQAMTGMMQGYMAGRKDVYEKNEKEFEKKFKEVKARHEELTKRFNEGLAMLPYDMTKAKNSMLSALSAEGSEVAKKMVQAGQYKQAAELMASGTKGIFEIEKLKQQMADRHEQRQLQKEIALARLEAAREKAAAGTGKGGAGGYVQNFNEQVTNAVGVVTKEIGNLKNIKFGGTGWFQGRNTSDFYNAPLGTLINEWTPANTQHLITNMGNLGYSLAKVESGGRAVTQKTIDQFNNQFALRTGDDPGVIMHKLAQLRQTLLVAIETRKNSAKRTGDEGMYNQLNAYEKELNDSIPFTVSDVLKVFTFDKDFSRSKKRKEIGADETFGSYMQRTMGTPAPEAPPIPKIEVELAPPKVGEIQNGYRFKGGNPGDPESWEPVQ